MLVEEETVDWFFQRITGLHTIPWNRDSHNSNKTMSIFLTHFIYIMKHYHSVSKKKKSNIIPLTNCAKDSILSCVCSVIDHRWHQSVVRTKKWYTKYNWVCHLILYLPWVTKREFLLTISIQHQPDKWWEWRKILIWG